MNAKREDANGITLTSGAPQGLTLASPLGLAVNLSHGQRRLLEIARTLGSEPEFFLFDEPTVGIFPHTLPQLLEIIRGLKGAGKTVLFIEHNLSFVMELADRIVVINHGKKIAEGAPAEIRNNGAVLDAYMGKGRKGA